MIKLVMVIPSLKTGGAERIFSFIANQIDSNRFKVYLILFDAKNIQFALNEERVTVIDLKKAGIMRGAWALIKQLRTIKPNVVFSTVTHLNIMLGMIRPFLHKSKFVVREASVISINNQYQPFPKVFNALIRFFYKNLDVIICQSKDMADDLINNYNIPANKIVTINNPITKVPKVVGSKKVTTVQFVSVGRLIHIKGFERLINIVSRLEIDFRYAIAGDGVEYENLKAKINEMGLQEKIILLGKVDDLGSLYESTDFYLHGSYYEGFPNALVEAGSYGVPIISFNTLGGINEIIKEGFNGLIVENEDEFKEAILKAKVYDWDRALIQKDIYDRFNKSKILTEYETVLSS